MEVVGKKWKHNLENIMPPYPNPLNNKLKLPQHPLSMLEQFAIESGYPLYALNVALNMCSGQRRILVQGAVSEGVTAMCDLPPGCGHAVDMLHAFLIKSLCCAGRQ
eukprot:1197579-Amphidinium_carterae.1